MQTRAVALHHLDCPWRPADVAQREGRILRQGNQNPEVRILRYVTEHSFDGYMWQAVERKARFIAQIMRGRLDVREIEDIGDAALSYNEVKALAAGNPLLMEKAEADAELTRLQRAERAHHRNYDALRYKIASTEQRIRALTGVVAEIDAAIGRRRDTRGDAFIMTIDGARFGKRSDAGEWLRQVLGQRAAGLNSGSGQVPPAAVGGLGGFDVTAAARRVLGTAEVIVAIDGVPGAEIRLSTQDLAAADPAGLIIRLENRLTGLEALKTRTLNDVERLGTEVTRAREDAAKLFAQAGDLAVARDRVHDIERRLEEAATPQMPDEPREPAEDRAGDPVNLVGVPAATEIRAGLALAVIAGDRSPGTVKIAQHGFPEINPLANSNRQAVPVAERPAPRPEHGPRPAP